MTSDTIMLTAIGLALLGLFGLFFISPSWLAFHKGHKYRWVILFINVVFGFTLIGWFGALIWALAGDDLI